MPVMRLSARGGWLLPWLTILVAAVRGDARAAEEPFRFDPVTALRQALKVPLRDVTPDSPDLLARRQALQDRTAALCSLPELREALLLDEWRDEDPGTPLVAIDQAVRLDLARRFEQALCEVLQKGDRVARLAAANMLAETTSALWDLHLPGWEPRGLGPVLAELVRENDPELRKAAARALSRLDADPVVALPAFRNLFQAGDPVLRRVAVDGLACLVKRVSQPLPPHPESAGDQLSPENLRVIRAVLPAVADGLTDADADVQRLSMEALQLTAQAAALLVDSPHPGPASLPEEAEAYRLPVATERAELEPLARDLKDLTASLTPALNDRDPAVRLRAHQTVEALSMAWRRLQDRAASVTATGSTAPAGNPAPTLMPVLATQPQTLDWRPANRWLTLVPVLAWGASDPDVRVRRAAIEALEALGDEAVPAAHALVCALGDPDVFVRWGAARTLGRIGPVPRVAVVPALKPLLADPDLDVRLAAAEAVRSFGPAAAEVVPTLTKMVVTGTPALRLAAMQALEGIGLPAQAAIPAVAAALQTPDVRVRLAAARLLGKFGPAALEAREALRAALHDPDAEVRKTVSDALLHILPPPGRAAPIAESPLTGSPEDSKLIPASFPLPTSPLSPPTPARRVRTLFAEDR
jgi:HEAT repeat protein